MGVGDKLQRRKTASFSSSLLDTIYDSIDEAQDFQLHRRNKSFHVEQEVESLRRAIMVEKWMHTTPITNATSETESSVFPRNRAKNPCSPRGKISNFFNSIFSPRSLKKKSLVVEEWNNSIRKSKSIDRTPSYGNNRSKRCATFVDEESIPKIGSQFIKKNIDSFRLYEAKNPRKNEFTNLYENENENDFDDKSCASSHLFELDNINQRIGAYEEELPVYGTTNLKHLIM